MKLKYFIRGLGIGIIFGAIVMLVAYNSSDKDKITDAEVIERAKELGMVMQEATQTDAAGDITETSIKADTETATEASDKADTETATEASDKADTETATETAAEKKTENTTEVTTAVTTEVVVETTTEKKTEAKTEAATEEINNSYTEATITVTRGMGSTEVAGLLQRAGIIEDAADFDSYLVKQGISNKIQINTYKFNSNMSYEDIGKELTTPKNN